MSEAILLTDFVSSKCWMRGVIYRRHSQCSAWLQFQTETEHSDQFDYILFPANLHLNKSMSVYKYTQWSRGRATSDGEFRRRTRGARSFW